MASVSVKIIPIRMNSSLPDPLPGLTYTDSVGRCQLPGVGRNAAGTWMMPPTATDTQDLPVLQQKGTRRQSAGLEGSCFLPGR